MNPLWFYEDEHYIVYRGLAMPWYDVEEPIPNCSGMQPHGRPHTHPCRMQLAKRLP